VAPIRLCSVSEVPDGALAAFFLEGWEVMVLRDSKGVLRAFDGTCPHEDFPLVDGIFDGSTITCRGHRWIFDAHTGRGLNPPGCAVSQYPLTVEGDELFVDLETEGEAEVPVTIR
jgi:toluene monooxygenase system ferredoxin subunit